MGEISIRSGSDFEKHFNVSRETLERLQIYVQLLCLWQKRINLVSEKTLEDVWDRHISDSAQLFTLIQDPLKTGSEGDNNFDLGSGAGFPGLVLSIMSQDMPGAEDNPITFSLVEGSAKKCAFLREVIRETGAPAQIVNKRIESLSQISNSINTRLITARALAPLSELCKFSEPVWSPRTRAYFLKGNHFSSEVKEARKNWAFDLNQFPSLTSQDSIILELTALNRKEIEG